jgi:hypothetical protein
VLRKVAHLTMLPGLGDPEVLAMVQEEILPKVCNYSA